VGCAERSGQGAGFIAGGRCVGGGCGQREGELAVEATNGEARADVGAVLERDVRVGTSARGRGAREGREGERGSFQSCCSLVPSRLGFGVGPLLGCST
jgi:hypothetical protein